MNPYTRFAGLAFALLLAGAGPVNGHDWRVAADTAKVEGTVTDSAGKPAAKYTIKLIQREYASQQAKSAMSQDASSGYKVLKTTVTNDEGKFKFESLKPGVYFLSDPSGTGEKFRQKVKLAAGQSITVQVQLP